MQAAPRPINPGMMMRPPGGPPPQMPQGPGMMPRPPGPGGMPPGTAEKSFENLFLSYNEITKIWLKNLYLCCLRINYF